MKKKGIFIGLMMMSPAIFAEGFYVGAGLGQKTAQDIGETMPGVTTTTDDTSGTGIIFGGLRVSPNLRLEARYEDLGWASIRYDDTFGNTILIQAQARATSLSVIGETLIQNRLRLFGRAGIAFASVDVTQYSNFSSTTTSSGTSNKPVFGVGLQYDLPGSALIIWEAGRYQDVGNDATTGTADIDFIGISVAMRI